jgi:hypothetical protein
LLWVVRLSGLVGSSSGAGCGHSLESELEGRWLGQAAENVAAEQAAAVTGWVRGTSFEFGDSKVTVAIPAEAPRTGPYKVLSSKGNTLRVGIQRDDGNTDIAELSLEESDHQMRWRLGQGVNAILKRED